MSENPEGQPSAQLIAVTLPDGRRREFPGPISGADLAAAIGAGLARAALAVKIDGQHIGGGRGHLGQRKRYGHGYLRRGDGLLGAPRFLILGLPTLPLLPSLHRCRALEILDL